MNDPYVPTTTGWRRKIGPKSKYGFNESSATRTSQRVGSTPSRLGSAMPQRESGFAVSMREAREVSEANKFDRRKPKSAAPSAGSVPLESARNGPATTKIMGMLGKARAAGKAPMIYRPKKPATSKSWQIGIGPNSYGK